MPVYNYEFKDARSAKRRTWWRGLLRYSPHAALVAVAAECVEEADLSGLALVSVAWCLYAWQDSQRY